MRTMRGLYQLKLAAEYALLQSVPLTLNKDSLTGYNTYSIMKNAQADIRESIWTGLLVRSAWCAKPDSCAIEPWDMERPL